MKSSDRHPTTETYEMPFETINLEDVDGQQVPVTMESSDQLIAGRYRDLGPLGVGGMGEVRRVWDTRLARTTAMKIIRTEKAIHTHAVERFVREAHSTGRLQHPGIVPVHDMGRLEDGRWWFTMKEILGRTYEDALTELHHLASPDGWPTRPGGPGFRRLVDALLRACQTMAYAHAEGFVHRDLKPENLMLGRYGEVQVLDWGLAKLINSASDDAAGRPEGLRDQADHKLRVSTTLDGGVLGSPPYMAPEQARGELERLGPAMDVYALGSVLYHLMAGVPPYRGRSARDVVEQVRAGPPQPVARAARYRCPEPDPELVTVCERSMARDPGQRFAHAGELARALEEWLDGTRRLEEARAIVLNADAGGRELERRREQAAALRRESVAVLARIEPDAVEEQSHPAWEMEDQADALDREQGMLEAEYEVALQSALKLAPALPEAHDRLSDLYRRRLEQAEEDQDARLVARNEAMLRAHDRGRHTAWLRADGRLSLRTNPPGAQVRVFRLVQRHRRLEPVEVGVVGHTPLVQVEVPRGSILVQVELDGRVPLRLPFLVRRGQHLDQIPPYGGEAVVHPLHRPEELGADAIQVPGGWAVIGGDSLALDPMPRRQVWIDGFVISRTHITTAAYRAFLEDIAQSGRHEEADRRVPRDSGTAGIEPHWLRAADGRYVPAPRAQAMGNFDDARLPITRITWDDARAYAEWRASREGLPWRLPHDLEWEKAARGCDGRAYPWGDTFAEGRACVARRGAGPPRIAPVGSYPHDTSPFGMKDAAGNVRTWCGNPFSNAVEVGDGQRLAIDPSSWTQPATFRMVRGGSFASQPDVARICSRFGSLGDISYAGVGLQIARPLPGSSA